MELEQLLKQRDAYGAKILRLGIQVAAIFIIPVGLALGISHLLGIGFIYLFPIAFVTSWTLVFFLYRKMSREVKALDEQIRNLKQQMKDVAQDQAQSDI